MAQPITAAPVTAPHEIRLVPDPDTDVWVYPEHLDGDRGTYPQQVLAVADELTQAGISTRLVHDLTHVDAPADRGPVAEAAIAIILGIASSAGWDAIKAMLRRRPRDQQLTVTLGWNDTTGEHWTRLDGPAHAIADTLNQLNP